MTLLTGFFDLVQPQSDHFGNAEGALWLRRPDAVDAVEFLRTHWDASNLEIVSWLDESNASWGGFFVAGQVPYERLHVKPESFDGALPWALVRVGRASEHLLSLFGEGEPPDWLKPRVPRSRSRQQSGPQNPDPLEILSHDRLYYRAHALELTEELANTILDSAASDLERKQALGAIASVGFLRSYLEDDFRYQSIGEASVAFAWALAELCIGDRVPRIRELGRRLRALVRAFQD